MLEVNKNSIVFRLARHLCSSTPLIRAVPRPSEPLRLVRFRPHHFFAEVGVVLFARALIITLLFSLGKMASMLDSKGEL